MIEKKNQHDKEILHKYYEQCIDDLNKRMKKARKENKIAIAYIVRPRQTYEDSSKNIIWTDDLDSQELDWIQNLIYESVKDAGYYASRKAMHGNLVVGLSQKKKEERLNEDDA